MLENTYLAGKTVATPYGDVIFNEQGISNNLPDNVQKELASKVPSYTFIAGKNVKSAEAPKEAEEQAVEKPAEVAEKPKEPAKVQETKAPAKKATNKKPTTKK